jgi:hypothetical protein
MKNLTYEFYNLHKYFIVHKPIGIVSTKSDPEKSKTVYDLANEKGFPTENIGLVGRLDKLTSGIMLFTNDGRLNRALSYPIKENNEDICNKKNEEAIIKQNKIDENFNYTYIENDNFISNKYLFKEKEYILGVSSIKLFNQKENRPLNENELNKIKQDFSEPFSFLRRNIIRNVDSAKIELLKYYQNPELSKIKPYLGWCLEVFVNIKEGKHHQIRRIARRSNMKVFFLKRIKIANILSIDTIPNEGDCRYLSYNEVKTIYEGLGIYYNQTEIDDRKFKIKLL